MNLPAIIVWLATLQAPGACALIQSGDSLGSPRAPDQALAPLATIGTKEQQLARVPPRVDSSLAIREEDAIKKRAIWYLVFLLVAVRQRNCFRRTLLAHRNNLANSFQFKGSCYRLW